MFRKRLGDFGEDLARTLLESRGYEIIEGKYHTRYGELDLVARDGETLVFVEVKTRVGQKYGSGLVALTKGKQRHMHRAALIYMMRKGYRNCLCRFDILALTLDHQGRLVDYDWVINAFEVEGGNYY